MSLSPSKQSVLDEISSRMPKSATWCLFGSTDTALRGLEENPSDIDILATEDAAETFRTRFPESFIGTHEVGQSQIDEYDVNGEEVEVIFSRRQKVHQAPLVQFEDVELVTGNTADVPLLPLETLLQAYREIDKLETVRHLETHLEDE